MTTFEKNWISKANIPLDLSEPYELASHLLWELKKALTDPGIGAWIVEGSCDGQTFGMDGIDRWTDPTKLVWSDSNTGTRIRSWIVLRSPGIDRPAYLTFECVYGSGSFRIGLLAVISSSRPTGGSDRAVGSARASPTSPGEGTITSGSWLNHVVTYIPLRFHHSRAEDGSFVFCWNFHSRSTMSGLFHISRLAETRPHDLAPWVSGFDSNTSTGSLSNNELTQSAATVGHDGHTLAIADFGIISSVGAVGSVSSGFVRNLFSFTSDVADEDPNSRPDSPIWLLTETPSGGKSIRGRLQDIRWAPMLPHGTVEPSMDSPRSVAVGPFWFPMSEAPDMS